MSAVIDRLLVAAAIALSVFYAFSHLAPRAAKLWALRLLVRAVQALKLPATAAVQTRTARALARLESASGCGGCGSCESSDSKAPGAEEQRISPASIGRRSR